MTTINEPFFALLGAVPPSASGAAAYNRIEGKEYQSSIEQPHEGFADARLPVPLYLIAAAALLG
jgi:hypothetical protein